MRVIIYILFLLCLTSCGGDEELTFSSDEELEAYLNDIDNGYILSSESSDMKFDVKFVPSEASDSLAQITMKLRINTKTNAPVLDFGNASKEEALQREGYLSFEVKKDVFLECNDEKITPLFHHYERNYGLKPGLDMYFDFQGVRPEDDVYFVYRDELFDQGLIRIKFKKQLFKNCYVEK